MDVKQAQEITEPGGPSLVQSLSRGLGILGQFTAEDKTLSLAELTRRTGLHKATVHRFVKTLESEGYLTSVSPGIYSVGPVWAMSLFALGSETVFSEIVSSDLSALAETSLETVALGVRQGEKVRVMHVLPSGRSFIPVLPPGRVHPLHATWNVHSQILVAFADEGLRRQVLAVPQTRYTEHTVVGPEAVKQKLEQVRRDGVAYDREEFHVGTCAVAVPAWWRDRVVAALALVVPVERFTEESVEAYVKQLHMAVDGIRKRLGE